MLALPGAVFLLFLGLKLTEVIDWPWVWILAPLWLPAAFCVGAVLMAGFVAAIKIKVERK